MTYSKSNGAFLIRLMPGEEVVASLQRFCEQQQLTGGFISGLGAASEVEYGYFHLETKQYSKFTKQHVEVTNLSGNIAVDRLHLHVTVGDSAGQALAGHLMRCVADPTMEIMITPFPKTHRVADNYSGLNLLDLDKQL